jgi:hypothetical protein
MVIPNKFLEEKLGIQWFGDYLYSGTRAGLGQKFQI